MTAWSRTSTRSTCSNWSLALRASGVDEMAIRKGHDYRIVVSDLDRRLPIWVGGTGCTEADRDLFFAALGRWKPL